MMPKSKITTQLPQIGDVIKAYDFPGNLECYMIGRVSNIDNDFIYCSMVKEVFDGQRSVDPDKSFQCPRQGLAFGDDSFQRVVILG
jgi:hypothetical protein